MKFSAWTFGDQVPGPTSAREWAIASGSSMTNRSAEPVGRVERQPRR